MTRFNLVSFNRNTSIRPTKYLGRDNNFCQKSQKILGTENAKEHLIRYYHDDILAKVKFFSKQLKLKLCKSTGRKLAITGEETVALALFKQNTGILTKKKVWEIFQPKKSYKTLRAQMNRFALQALVWLGKISLWGFVIQS
ncbi:hypothetical protein A2641_01060 [Candidatus Nomurabacteria bacterium RIFCSPHIGHO2_01_FULL_37_25]|uniref:Uncharacterized protein n=1 Tax=Candidatus Nomurabacteria bacterium RIFCSPLOWO2_01_FULL_36_16 TaxID=1801767 RepID=A0A1F6WZA6_9BACT|nr:MAG: hypothetical protein A2641_01060 [Candidatus Nomurabacteria bacterium RIFCSPHIGHO2_01_FULL_37_25]OGI75308.1 MAG: hypothetical protein A3D36_01960 [Candidatus Nomurabacteria bacterium RIFCSPHIGHO2_02_FULL_36_29]OGI87055.1 MAG: hypothetical protein A3A91_00055 [Candidatus Nomurabacteria bacterium RIFCSPLOWO2_01_FULL_36_16]OGI95920.1 MAG: hypothetical protein A3I84_01205 [Candidatus Nomurabacteria bacterium RIFCSPLOWO2_02_FULL_36_8]